MSFSEIRRYRRLRDHGLVGSFKSALFQLYRKHVGRKAVFNRKLDFFTKFAEDYFNANVGFTPLETITIDDFPNYSFNEKSYAWTKKVIPVIYQEEFPDENETLELVKGGPSNHTKSTFLFFFEDVFEVFFQDMIRGRPLNMPFMLSLQRIAFETIGEANKFLENDFIGNRRRLTAMIVTFRTDVDEIEEFDGVRYQVSPQRPYDFLCVSNDDALTIAQTFNYDETLDSTVVQGEPMKLGEVLDEPSVIIPFSLLDKTDLKRILREANFDGDDRQALFRFMKSNFFKNEKWSIMVEGTSAHFLVPKDVVLQRPYDSSVVGGGEHE